MYPRKLTTIHQIEPTSECNLRCKYCPHPKMLRVKKHMDMFIFEQALDIVRYFVKQGTQGELSLTGVGEPTMHPYLVDMVKHSRDVLGPDRLLLFSIIFK